MTMYETRRVSLLQHDQGPDHEPGAYMLDVAHYFERISQGSRGQHPPAQGKLLAVDVVDGAIVHKRHARITMPRSIQK